MCSECGKYPCHPRCPNADDDGAWGRCDRCGEEIYYGDRCIDDDLTLCECCIDDMDVTEFLRFTAYDFSTKELLDALGVEIIRAGE